MSDHTTHPVAPSASTAHRRLVVAHPPGGWGS
ncbi:hypothetical protein HNR49_002176 [Halobacterium salinarum]|uniref:Uncharacterized protein n=1 Tax=Halobacterium salinarum TaxID=2242 RepID=A0A841HCL4_HALSI|nr:hypothetical protein [Halobacterium salinarum]